MIDGEPEAGAWSCGMVAGLIHDIPTCKELIDQIMKESEDIITNRLGGFLKKLIYLFALKHRVKSFNIFNSF